MVANLRPFTTLKRLIQHQLTPLSPRSKPDVGRRLCSSKVSTSPQLTGLKDMSPSQPTPWSHPNILKQGEVTPGITGEEYSDRRRRTMDLVCKMGGREKLHVYVLTAASVSYISDKIPYVFRQNTDFFYLTGCLEPGVVLVMTARPNSSTYSSALFIPKTDSHSEMWEGRKLDLEQCTGFLNMDEAYHTAELAPYLNSLLSQHRMNGVYVWRDSQRPCDVVSDVISRLGGSFALGDAVDAVQQLRIIKSPAERDLMRKTCEVISKSISNTMKSSRPDCNEHELWATVDYHSRMLGAQFLAYPPVVAGGARANTIHYTRNDQLVRDGELVLMDAGCQYYGYTSDVTRCWPVNGHFTAAQRAAYEAVLDVQEQIIRLCNEMPTLDQLFQRMCHLLGRNLRELGFGESSMSCTERARMAFSLCPHHVSHYLGLDVHDTGKIKRSLPLQPGMVITVEPGLYVNLNSSIAPKEFHGLGIRIEDDILITENGVEVLTRTCPKTVADIESLMASS